MTLLDRYLARRFIVLYLQVLLGFGALIVLVDWLTHRQPQMSKFGVPAGIAVEYYLSFLPTILFEYQLVPVAVLLACMILLGGAQQHNEITALLSGGVGLRRIVRAPMLLACLLAVAAFFLHDRFGADAIRESRRIDHEYFGGGDAGAREGVSWPQLSSGWSCHILAFNRDANTGQDVFAHRIQDGRMEEIRARRIWWDAAKARWLLEDGRWATFDMAKEGGGVDQRITQAAAPFTETPAELFALEMPPETKRADVLLEDLRRADALNMPTHQAWAGFHAKFARPFMCIVMALLAAPFALRLRRGGWAGMAMGIVLAVGYMVLFFAGMGMGQLGLAPPLLSAWLANAVFLCIGIAAFARTPT